MSDRSVECPFLWLIVNYPYCRLKNGEQLHSQAFPADEHEFTSWRMALYPRGNGDEGKGYVSLYLSRNHEEDDGPEEISLNYELSVLGADGSIRCSKTAKDTFEKGRGYGWPRFAKTEDVSQDTLIVCCRLWKGERKASNVFPIYSRTRIAVKSIAFLHVVEHFSTLKPNQPKTVRIESASEKGFAVSSSLYFNENSYSDGEMVVEITPSDSDHDLCERKISLLEASGNIVVCEENDNRFYVEGRDIRKLPFPLTRQNLLKKKSEYLLDDKLSLLCECYFSAGLEYEKLVLVPGEIPEIVRSLLKSDTEGERVECTFLWFVENYSYCCYENGEELKSPRFTADELEGTSWWMSVYPRGRREEDRGYISLYFGRNPVDDGPVEIFLNSELQVHAADGSTLHSEVHKDAFGKGRECGWSRFVETEGVSQDTLIVRCRIWKGEGKVRRVAPTCARTRIAVENVSFLHEVENFGELEPNRELTVELQCESEKGSLVTSQLCFTDDPCCEGGMIVEITPADRNHKLCRRKISLLDAHGNTVVCDENDNRFDVERKDIEKLPFPLTRQIILNKKSEYLPDGKLSLLCECAFSSGPEYGENQETQQEVPAMAGRGVGVKRVPKGISGSANQALSMEEKAETESSTFNFTLNYNIENFSTANEEICKKHLVERDFFEIGISVSVFPNGVYKSDEGWLVLRPVVTVLDVFNILKACVLKCTMSIIDIERNCRFSRCFEIYSHNDADDKDNLGDLRYLKKSSILDRADELVSKDNLLLRCDIRTDLDVEKGNILHSGSSISYLRFLPSVPNSNCSRKVDETVGTIRIHDFSSLILTLLEYERTRGRLDACGVPIGSKEDKIDNPEDVWMFDTNGKRFFLSFDRRPRSVGRLLLDASPVIGRCINAPWKEQDEKRIDLSHVDSGVFLLVLHFLESGELPSDRLSPLKGIYKFSHMYEMEYLQQKCAERMVAFSKHEHQLDEIKGIADMYSDEYLLDMLESRLREFGNSDRTGTDDRPNFDCYI